MANTMSKLIVGGSVFVVMLMLFSAIPVAADVFSSDNAVMEISHLKEKQDKEPIEINEQITLDENNDLPSVITERGDMSWDKTNKILTMDDANIHSSFSSNEGAIRICDGSTIVLNGNSTIVFDGITGICSHISDYGNLSVTGGGHLTLKTGDTTKNSVGIQCKTLIISNCSLRIECAQSGFVLTGTEGAALNVSDASLSIDVTGKSQLSSVFMVKAFCSFDKAKLDLTVHSQGKVFCNNYQPTAEFTDCGEMKGTLGYETEESFNEEHLLEYTGLVSTGPGPEPGDGNLPIYVGVALLIIAIVAVGMYVAFKS